MQFPARGLPDPTLGSATVRADPPQGPPLLWLWALGAAVGRFASCYEPVAVVKIHDLEEPSPAGGGLLQNETLKSEIR